MIRFDIEQEPSRKPLPLESILCAWGGYSFLPPLVWACFVVSLLRCVSLEDSPLPQHPEWVNDVWFADTPYVVLLLAWFLGFWPISVLSSWLYRRQSENWWKGRWEREARRELVQLRLEVLVRPEESLLAAVRFNVGGLFGGCAADVVWMTSVLYVALCPLITMAIFSLIYGPPTMEWFPRGALIYIGIIALRAFSETPTVVGVSITASCPGMVWAIKAITDMFSAPWSRDYIPFIPAWLVWLSLIPLAVHLVRVARSPRLHWLVITDQRILGFVPEYNFLSVWRRGVDLCEVCLCWLLFSRVKAEWEHGGTITLTRNQHSDIVTVASQGSRRQSMYITREEAAALTQLISEKQLAWTLVDDRDAPTVKRRLRTVAWVDAFVAVAIAFGAARVSAPIFSTGITARYALLPTYEAAQRGDTRLLDDLLPRVLTVRPNDALVWCYKAMAEEKLGRRDDACASWQRALDLTDDEGKVGRAASAALKRLCR